VLTGTLTMHGVTRDVTLAVEFNGAVTDPWGNDRVGFAATGTLNRQDFGLTYGTVMEGGGLVIGNDVGFALEIEGTRKK
jgi:polyisoprenoid-binding protein YceI